MHELQTQSNAINISAHQGDGFGIGNLGSTHTKSLGKDERNEAAAEHCEEAIRLVLICSKGCLAMVCCQYPAVCQKKREMRTVLVQLSQYTQ